MRTLHLATPEVRRYNECACGQDAWLAEENCVEVKVKVDAQAAQLPLGRIYLFSCAARGVAKRMQAASNTRCVGHSARENAAKFIVLQAKSAHLGVGVERR
jgi:hypothetical protein